MTGLCFAVHGWSVTTAHCLHHFALVYSLQAYTSEFVYQDFKHTDKIHASYRLMSSYVFVYNLSPVKLCV